jgi:hypothetical protein
MYHQKMAFCCAFLWAKELNAMDSHEEMFLIYCGKCLPRKVVQNLVEKFSQGRSKFADDLKFRKVCARWVAREQKDREKMNGMGLALQHLLRYADEGKYMLNRIVTMDESWVHHYQPESKRASVQGKYPSSPSTKNFKVTTLAWKVMLTVFWDFRGVLLAHFQKRGENVNFASYCEVLLKLRDAIRRKLTGQLATASS